MISYEELKRLLEKTPNIRNLKFSSSPKDPDQVKPGEFDRYAHFDLRDESFVIGWWANIAYLQTKSQTLIAISFDMVKLSTTWPCRSRINLQFYRTMRLPSGAIDTDTVAVMPLDPYED